MALVGGKIQIRTIYHLRSFTLPTAKSHLYLTYHLQDCKKQSSHTLQYVKMRLLQ